MPGGEASVRSTASQSPRSAGLEGKLGYVAGELLSLRQDIFLFSSSHRKPKRFSRLITLYFPVTAVKFLP